MKKIKNVLMILPLSILALNVQANPNIEKILNNKDFIFEELNENSKLKEDLYQKDGKLFYTYEDTLCEIKQPKKNKIFEKENQILLLVLKEEFGKIQEKKQLLHYKNVFNETTNFIKIFNKINENIFCNYIPYTSNELKKQKEMFFEVLKIREMTYNDFLEKNKDVSNKDPEEQEIINLIKRELKMSISSNLEFKEKIKKYYFVLEQNLK